MHDYSIPMAYSYYLEVQQLSRQINHYPGPLFMLLYVKCVGGKSYSSGNYAREFDGMEIF